MRIRKLHLKSSFFNLLGYHATAEEVPQPLLLEELRIAMLATLGKADGEHHAQVARKLRCASDAMALWYTRSELMAALAALHGEAHARQEMDHLTARFRPLLPQGMTTGTVRAPR